MSKNSWYSSGICSFRGTTFFFSSCVWWRSWEVVIFVFIQMFGSSCSVFPIIWMTRFSSSDKGFIGLFLKSSSSSFSSLMKACRSDFSWLVCVGETLKLPSMFLDIGIELSVVSPFFCKESQIESSVGFLLIFINWGFLFSEFLQENSPVFKFISGLCSFSHGNLRMIFCFPSPVTNNWVFLLFPKIVRSRSTKLLIVPRLFPFHQC